MPTREGSSQPRNPRNDTRDRVEVRWGKNLLAAYVGGLVIGAPIGLVLYGITHISYLLTAAIVVSMLSVLIWRLRTQS